MTPMTFRETRAQHQPFWNPVVIWLPHGRAFGGRVRNKYCSSFRRKNSSYIQTGWFTLIIQYSLIRKSSRRLFLELENDNLHIHIYVYMYYYYGTLRNLSRMEFFMFIVCRLSQAPRSWGVTCPSHALLGPPITDEKIKINPHSWSDAVIAPPPRPAKTNNLQSRGKVIYSASRWLLSETSS